MNQPKKQNADIEVSILVFIKEHEFKKLERIAVLSEKTIEQLVVMAIRSKYL